MKRVDGLREMLPRDWSEAGEMLRQQWKRNKSNNPYKTFFRSVI